MWRTAISSQGTPLSFLKPYPIKSLFPINITKRSAVDLHRQDTDCYGLFRWTILRSTTLLAFLSFYISWIIPLFPVLLLVPSEILLPVTNYMLKTSQVLQRWNNSSAALSVMRKYFIFGNAMHKGNKRTGNLSTEWNLSRIRYLCVLCYSRKFSKRVINF